MSKLHFGTEECLWSYWAIVIFRQLKVEIRWSSVSTDGFHSKTTIKQQFYSLQLFDFFSDFVHLFANQVLPFTLVRFVICQKFLFCFFCTWLHLLLFCLATCLLGEKTYFLFTTQFPISSFSFRNVHFENQSRPHLF